jgi:hypothetical protein
MVAMAVRDEDMSEVLVRDEVFDPVCESVCLYDGDGCVD